MRRRPVFLDISIVLDSLSSPFYYQLQHVFVVVAVRMLLYGEANCTLPQLSTCIEQIFHSEISWTTVTLTIFCCKKYFIFELLTLVCLYKKIFKVKRNYCNCGDKNTPPIQETVSHIPFTFPPNHEISLVAEKQSFIDGYKLYIRVIPCEALCGFPPTPLPIYPTESVTITGSG